MTNAFNRFDATFMALMLIILSVVFFAWMKSLSRNGRMSRAADILVSLVLMIGILISLACFISEISILMFKAVVFGFLILEFLLIMLLQGSVPAIKKEQGFLGAKSKMGAAANDGLKTRRAARR